MATFGTDVAQRPVPIQSILDLIHKMKSKMKVRSFFKMFLMGTAIFAMWTPTSPAKECAVFYEHPHQGGAAWGLEAETESANISNAMIERRTWCGSLRGYCKGRDRSWNDSVSSIRVNPGCHLMTWSDQDYTGDTKLFYASSLENVYGSLDIDDRITSFRCTCSASQGSPRANIMYHFHQGANFSEAENP